MQWHITYILQFDVNMSQILIYTQFVLSLKLYMFDNIFTIGVKKKQSNIKFQVNEYYWYISILKVILNVNFNKKLFLELYFCSEYLVFLHFSFWVIFFAFFSLCHLHFLRIFFFGLNSKQTRQKKHQCAKPKKKQK